MSVRAKFTCTSKKEVQDSGFVIELLPVTCGSVENESFYKYTPYGKLELGTINKQAADQFTVGASYYIDITKAE